MASEKTEEHPYKIAYRVYHQPNGATKEFLKEHEFGGCDDIILISIVKTLEGDTSTAFLSMRGSDGNPLPDDEIFKAWVLMAKNLSESKTLSMATKLLCKTIFKTVSDALKAFRVKGSN